MGERGVAAIRLQGPWQATPEKNVTIRGEEEALRPGQESWSLTA